MNKLFDLNDIRLEISFKSYDELRGILSFFQKNQLNKVNIPCKNGLKKEFLLNSIRISKQEFPNIDIIPHFSILHEFRRNSLNTQKIFNDFLNYVKYLGCKNVLLVSGSKKKSTLDSVKTLILFQDNPLFFDSDFSIGVAFNPYLSSFMFDDEILRLEQKLNSGLVNSIWIQFGTDIKLLDRRIDKLKEIILSTIKNNPKISNIRIFGSILIPSKQFLARFKYRPWKGVYCSNEFLESVDIANNYVREILLTYKFHNISPIIETNISNNYQLMSLKNFLNNS